jgi:hypothetical protein
MYNLQVQDLFNNLFASVHLQFVNVDSQLTNVNCKVFSGISGDSFIYWPKICPVSFINESK